MMKRISLRMLSMFLLALLAVSSFAACNAAPSTDSDQPSDTTNSTEQTESTEQTGTVDPFVYLQEDLTPYITLGNYRDITVIRASSVVTDEDLAAYIQEVCEYYAVPAQITDRAAAEDDTVNFDFAGYIDGEQFDNGTAAGQSITLTGTGGYIEGFVPAIIGKMPGESFEIVTTFPEDYGVDELNGKEAVFKCTLNYIEGDLIVPEFNDELAQEISEFQTADELSAYLRTAMEEELANSSINQLYTDVWTQVVNNATIHSYPEEKVQYVYEQNVSTYTMYGAIYYNESYEQFLLRQGMTDDDVLEEAKSMIKEDLVFYAIVKAENISISDEEFEAELPEFAAYYGYDDPQGIVDTYGKEAIVDGMLWNKTQDLLLSWANIVDEE